MRDSPATKVGIEEEERRQEGEEETRQDMETPSGLPIVEDKMKTRKLIKKQVVMHSYYEKPVTSKMVMMSKIAHPQKQKITTLFQDVVRRMRNTSRKVLTQERIKIHQMFIKNMKENGYEIVLVYPVVIQRRFIVILSA